MERDDRCLVIVVALNRHQQVASLIKTLSDQLPEATGIVVVDDGSQPPLSEAVPSAPEDVTILRHEANLGVSAGRNTAIDYCRKQGAEIAVMIDSDCIPLNDFIAQHMSLHKDRPDVAAIGGAIIGIGSGFWAKVDGIMSWVHSMPLGEEHLVRDPYHLPTTNFSLKLADLPEGAAFDERLYTGEDALLIRRLRDTGKKVLFSPAPKIEHRDRERFIDVLRHHYIWGYHQYFVQLGGNVSARCFSVWYRACFVPVFAILAPVFALCGAVLNLWPWVRSRPAFAVYLPVVLFIWLTKAIAVLNAAIAPGKCLRLKR